MALLVEGAGLHRVRGGPDVWPCGEWKRLTFLLVERGPTGSGAEAVREGGRLRRSAGRHGRRDRRARGRARAIFQGGPACVGPLLYELVREHWPRFVERAEEQGGGLPQFVVHELEGYLRCGIHHTCRGVACPHMGRVAFAGVLWQPRPHADLKHG